MKLHKRTHHSQNKSSQYEEVAHEEYSCFYCETNINSQQILKDHRKVCTENYGWETSQIDTYPCNECGAEYISLEEWGRHMKTFHSTKTTEEEPEAYCCDICPLHFKRKVDLEFHKRGCHWVEM